ncbi:hypothetical protein KW791_02130 [Candidatus Parcubacteria bacterium]|nr:hypothetical protein [Candidatus Parcubacteria bacterium]
MHKLNLMLIVCILFSGCATHSSKPVGPDDDFQALEKRMKETVVMHEKEIEKRWSIVGEYEIVTIDMSICGKRGTAAFIGEVNFKSNGTLEIIVRGIRGDETLEKEAFPPQTTKGKFKQMVPYVLVRFEMPGREVSQASIARFSRSNEKGEHDPNGKFIQINFSELASNLDYQWSELKKAEASTDNYGIEKAKEEIEGEVKGLSWILKKK